jgi:hypothetical protein
MVLDQKTAIQIEGLKRNNIGDVFQAIAVSDCLPHVDLVLDRENLPSASDKGNILLIANGWYMHTYENFPPPSNITPIYSSVHFSSAEILSHPRCRDHFRRFAPIGARDIKTLAMLRAARIPSYYSGCFTAAINSRRWPGSAASSSQLLVVDGIDHPLPVNAVEKIGILLSMNPIRVTHDPPFVSLSFDDYADNAIRHAESLLKRYCEASLVVTTKIHCALPCMAMGVPVILIHPNPREERLAPVREFIPVLSLSELSSLRAMSAPRMRIRALARRKDHIREFISQALHYGGNPVALSPRYRILRYRAYSLTLLWYLLFSICMLLGIRKDRLGKIMTSSSLLT